MDHFLTTVSDQFVIVTPIRWGPLIGGVGERDWRGGWGGGEGLMLCVRVPEGGSSECHPFCTLTPRRGGGGGTASLKVTTHCQTTAPSFSGLSAPEFFFDRPLFLGVADH